LQVLSKVAAQLLKTKDCGSIGPPQQKQTNVTPKLRAIDGTRHLQKAKATVEQ